VLGAALGGVTVVNVSRGNCGEVDALGGRAALGAVVEDATVGGTGAPTVALVDALSPLLMMTAVAMAPTATTAPKTAAAGRQRLSFGQASSS
jgi:hypothetical protein